MRLRAKGKIIYIEESAIIVLFVCLFSKVARDYLANYYYCYLYIVFHELAHITVAALLGSSVKGVKIRISGLSVVLDKKFHKAQAILVYLAGPIANFILALLFRNIDVVFEINMCLGMVNLFPLKPLDGYNILNEIASEKTVKNILKATEIIIIFLGVFLIVKFCNISLIILLLYIKTENLKSAK